MSREYSTKKIKEALHVTRGNKTMARQQVMAWAMEDFKLLKELVQPHMTGIIAHAIGRVESGKDSVAPAAPADASNDEKDTFGMDILKTIAGGDTAQFGQENHSRPVKKQGVSQNHIDAIQKMISKSSGKS